uniref:Conserved conjugative plasmid protein n=1 Tax=Saccharolobus solfataricus (strain ATCC 35092 / DSM 1617 / JCM 11322 / P2) TaxID=273057 RepID=S6DG82_SACS2|nr:conserved conjugative plasmid protein [Saccharolobus solfataricus P2]
MYGKRFGKGFRWYECFYITKYVRELESLGLISVTQGKTNVGTEKKIIKISDKGLQVINYIIKLNELLS